MRRTIPWAIVAIVAVAIAASAVLLASALRTQRDAGAEIRQRFENVLTLRRTQALLVDAETGQRGFLLTGQTSFLEPYERARQELPLHLRELVARGVTSPGGSLQKLSFSKLDELASTLRLARVGRKDAALALVASGAGKRDMDAIRAEIAALGERQRRQIESDIGRSERFTSRAYGALALLAVAVVALLWFGLSMILRGDRLEAETGRLRDVEQAEQRTQLVARELNHRVKNLFAVVLAIVQLAGRGAASPKDAVARIRERVQALARAHEVSLGNDPMGGFDLEALLRATLAPYVGDAAELELGGPPVRLPPMRVTPLGLIIHELATNAVKYGAWSSDGGKVDVRWSIAPAARGAPAADRLRLEWTELGSAPIQSQGAPGFGSRMIEAAVAQLDGPLIQERRETGLTVLIDAPIAGAQASTQAPADGDS